MNQNIEKDPILKIGAVITTLLVLILLALMIYWDHEPDILNISEAVKAAGEVGEQDVTGLATTTALIEVGEVLLNKRGGYLSNDVIPPSIFMDNIPSWEFGVITQMRDMARALRNDFSRSQTQSIEDSDLMVADPQLHIDHDSWMFPSAEGQYQEGINAVKKYRQRLQDKSEQQAQFYARADNLRDWLAIVEKRLGSLSQRLSASVGQVRINTDLSGEETASQSTKNSKELSIKTSWFEIDDVFYEARGSTWALLHFLKAMEIDLKSVLDKKNATVSLRQIVRELESTQDTVWSPFILNGTGFGLVTNHSLIMASYISRANAAVIDLRNLLEQG